MLPAFMRLCDCIHIFYVGSWRHFVIACFALLEMKVWYGNGSAAVTMLVYMYLIVPFNANIFLEENEAKALLGNRRHKKSLREECEECELEEPEWNRQKWVAHMIRHKCKSFRCPNGYFCTGINPAPVNIRSIAVGCKRFTTTALRTSKATSRTAKMSKHWSPAYTKTSVPRTTTGRKQTRQTTTPGTLIFTQVPTNKVGKIQTEKRNIPRRISSTEVPTDHIIVGKIQTAKGTTPERISSTETPSTQRSTTKWTVTPGPLSVTNGRDATSAAIQQKELNNGTRSSGWAMGVGIGAGTLILSGVVTGTVLYLKRRDLAKNKDQGITNIRGGCRNQFMMFPRGDQNDQLVEATTGGTIAYSQPNGNSATTAQQNDNMAIYHVIPDYVALQSLGRTNDHIYAHIYNGSIPVDGQIDSPSNTLQSPNSQYEVIPENNYLPQRTTDLDENEYCKPVNCSLNV